MGEAAEYVHAKVYAAEQADETVTRNKGMPLGTGAGIFGVFFVLATGAAIVRRIFFG